MHEVYASREASVRAWAREAGGEARTSAVVRGPLTLAHSVHIAIERNRALQAAYQKQEQAKGRTLEGYAIALPALSLQTGYSRLRDVPSFSAGGNVVRAGDYDNFSYSLTLKQPVLNTAVRPTMRASDLYTRLVEQDVRATVQQVIYETRRAYYDVLLARNLLAVAQMSVDAARAHLGEAEKRKRQGVASDFDVLRAGVELSNEQARHIRLKNQFRLAQTMLLRVMGISQQSQIELADPLEYEELRADLNTAVGAALRNRPELLQSELGVRLQQQLLEIARSGWWPKAFLLVTYRRAKPSPLDMTDNSWDDQLSAGLSLDIPLFDGLGTLGKVKQRKAEYERLKIELTDVEEAILLEVRQAVLSIEDAAELVLSQAANLGRAREGLRLAEARYRNGISTQVEVLDARAALVAAQGLHHQAVHDHVMARLKLEKATGALSASGAASAEERK